MRKRIRTGWLVVLLGAVMGPSSRAEEPTTPAPRRVIHCDQKLPSRKRGVGANHLGPEDFTALSPGVSWWYNWHYKTDEAPPKGVAMSFLPMVWGADSESLAGLERSLATGPLPRRVLALNEPNLRGQSFMAPEKAAAAYARIKAVADKYKIPMVGPQMSIGSAPADSVSAFDPIENKELTYTFMVPYLKAFFHYTDRSRVNVYGLGIHPYTNIWGLRALTELTHKEFPRPIWVTEFNNFEGSQSLDAIRTYLIQATDFLERTSYVEGYAFFKERDPNQPKISLLAEVPGKLTPLGEAYVRMPVHDADVFYRIPGRLQAENYVRLEKQEIWPTSDVDGFTQMTSLEPGGWLDYNLQVDQGGSYTLRFRVNGSPGTITIRQGQHLLGTRRSSPVQDRYSTVEISVSLASGPQTIRVETEAAHQGINWIEFIKR